MINSTLRYIRNLTLCFWLGEMLFFAAIFAPRVFKVLERPDAAKLQASIFPAYFMAGIVCGVLFFASVIALKLKGAYPVYKNFLITLILCSLAWIIFVYSYLVLTPAIRELQPLVLIENVLPENKIAFDKLHALSVRINGIALFSLLGLLWFSPKDELQKN